MKNFKKLLAVGALAAASLMAQFPPPLGLVTHESCSCVDLFKTHCTITCQIFLDEQGGWKSEVCFYEDTYVFDPTCIRCLWAEPYC